MPLRISRVKIVQNPQLELPSDILKVIFSFLSIADFLKIKQINHKWKAASEDENLWRNLIIAHFPFLSKTNTQEFLQKPKYLFIFALKNAFKLLREDKDAKRLLLQGLENNVAILVQDNIRKETKHRLCMLTAAIWGQSFIQSIDGKLDPAPEWSEILNIASAMNNLSVVEYCIDEIEKGNVDDRIKQEFFLNALLHAVSHGQNQLVAHFFTKGYVRLSEDEKALLSRCASTIIPQERMHQLMTQQSFLTISSEIISFLLNEVLETQPASSLLVFGRHLLAMSNDSHHFDALFLILKWAIEHNERDLVENIVLDHRLNKGPNEKMYFSNRYLIRNTLAWANEKGYSNISRCIEQHLKKQTDNPGHYQEDKTPCLLPMFEVIQQKQKKTRIGKREINNLCTQEERKGFYLAGKYQLRCRRF